MANKVFKGIRMPGLNDYYVLPEAVAIEDENGFVEIKSYISDTVEVENIDTTLTREGFAADAKAVGSAINSLASDIEDIKVSTEAWVFTMDDGTIISRSVYIEEGEEEMDELVFILEDGSTITKAVFAG